MLKARLEASVPSSTVSLYSKPSTPRGAPNPTQTHARALRVLLESLDDAQRARAELVGRAQRLSDADDVTPRVLQVAAGMEQWAEVRPEAFEDVLDEELAKYEKFRTMVEESEEKQEQLLSQIRVGANSLLSRLLDDADICI